MFTHASKRLGRRGITVLLDNAAVASPDDPLLFLYPQLVTSVSRQKRSITSTGATTDTRRAHGRDLPVSRRFSALLRRPSRQWSSSRTAVNNTTENGESQPATAAQDNSQNVKSVSKPTGSQNAPSASPVIDPIANEKQAALRLFANAETPNTKPAQRRLEVDHAGESLPNSMGEPGSWKAARDTLKSLPPRDARKLRRRHFFLETSGEYDRKPRRAQLTDVKDMLEKLQRDSYLWPEKGPNRKELLLPEETVMLLAGFSQTALTENVWYVPVLNGCRVHLLDVKKSEGPHRKVVLTGSSSAVGLVAHRIEQLRQRQASGDPLVDISSPPVPIYPSAELARRKNLPVPLIRGVWDYYTVFHRKPLHVVLDSRDSLTTVKEFNEFVEDLTTSDPSQLSRQESGLRHHEQVAETIKQLFMDESNSKLVSSAALNQALSFLVDHEFRPLALAVLQKTSHVATVVTFNILLRGAAKWLDIVSFRLFLTSMRRLRIRPDEWTWLAFLDCHVSSKGKISLVSYLLQKDYLTTDALRDILQLTIQELFSAHLDSGGDVDSFFDILVDSRISNSFGVPLLNQMFRVASLRKDHAARDRLLTICEEQTLPVDSTTIIQVVLSCRKNIFNALPFALRIMERGSHVADVARNTFDMLFTIAYRSDRYNICRVLWQYACMHKRVTRRMKSIVLDSLLACSETPPSGTDISKRFKLNAGKVIVGVGVDSQQIHPVVDDLPAEFRSDPLTYLVHDLRRDGTDPDLRRQVAEALVHHDIETGPDYEPARPLPLMLHAAMLVDKEWKFDPRPISWFLQNSLSIPTFKWKKRLSQSI